jgi:hypothetical protein
MPPRIPLNTEDAGYKRRRLEFEALLLQCRMESLHAVVKTAPQKRLHRPVARRLATVSSATEGTGPQGHVTPQAGFHRLRSTSSTSMDDLREDSGDLLPLCDLEGLRSHPPCADHRAERLQDAGETRHHHFLSALTSSWEAYEQQNISLKQPNPRPQVELLEDQLPLSPVERENGIACPAWAQALWVRKPEGHSCLAGPHSRLECRLDDHRSAHCPARHEGHQGKREGNHGDMVSCSRALLDAHFELHTATSCKSRLEQLTGLA